MRAALLETRLDRKQPLREQIYGLMRGLILTGKIAPGDSIDEKEIAALLKISRTPVREAVKKLSDENLVHVIAQSGTRASPIDRHEVEQAFIIRRALEIESAAQAANRMAQHHSDALSDLMTVHARAIERRNFIEAIKIDDKFHRYIAEISDLPRLWRAIEISKAQLDRCRYMMLPRPGEAEATLLQHADIIEALNSKDPDQARQAMAIHLDRSYHIAKNVLEAEARKD
jgi:GntR family transcriptional regulator, rspAB operon transcriptional repressor